MLFDCGAWSYATRHDSHREEDHVNEMLDEILAHPDRFPLTSDTKMTMEPIETEEDVRLQRLLKEGV